MITTLRQSKWLSKAVIMALDILLVVFIGALALFIRFDFSISQIPKDYLKEWCHFLPIQLLLTVGLFWLLRMYHYIWHTVGLADVARMIGSVMLTGLVTGGVQLLRELHLPISVLFMSYIMQIIALVGLRCLVRLSSELRTTIRRSGSSERIMLVGAGAAGRLLLQEMNNNDRFSGQVVCIIDDNKNKWGSTLNGIRIVGGRREILRYAKKERISQIILAMPSASAETRRQILAICGQTDCRVKMLPALYEMIEGDEISGNVRDVQVEDLLGRETVQLDTDALQSFLGGRTVLVTGGGGSIGSELCRQIAKYRPRQLIILDIYENNAYEIQQELRRTWGNQLDLRVEIASVRDKEKIYALFDQYRPDLVFHAAAHKHVPLMENCPAEAIKNNVFGTYHVIKAAEKYGAAKFVMISTDKAVNPTNFMGATKRFCEMIVQSRFDSPTEYCAVRFGNVLGSNGSVVPLFKRQIEEGGPVTITDKRIIRYFMTIPEAAQLVLEAGAMARQSQIFVLDMGEPVKILDLAENLIRLSGHTPYVDIDIKEIGLRPGEKLYEELLMANGDLSKTRNRKIFVEQQGEIDRDAIMDALLELDRAVTEQISNEELIALMKTIVPTYKDPASVNAAAEKNVAQAQKTVDSVQ